MFPVEQWTLPVSFSAGAGPVRMVTLDEYVKLHTESIPVESLTLPQRIEIAVKRIELQPESCLATVNDGRLGKKRMIEEIQAKTDLGRSLLEIQRRTIDLVIAAARKE